MEDGRPNAKKLVVFDIDGVIFKGYFMLRLSLFKGLLIYIRALFLCILFYIGRLSVQQLLREVYKRFKGTRLEDVWQIYNKMVIIRNARETITTLRQRGYHTAIVSSGVPDFLANDLCKRLSADSSFGIEGCERNGHLTGEVRGPLTLPHGKVKIIGDILGRLDMGWSDVVIIADDRNNLDVVKNAGLTIGVNAGYTIRQRAKYLIDSGNLTEVVDIMDKEYAATPIPLILGLKTEVRNLWRHELMRKLIHSYTATIPLVASYALGVTVYFLIITTAMFMVAELLRLNGKPLPFVNSIMQAAIRREEMRHLSTGPIMLAMGVILSLAIFSNTVASAAIWTVAIADSMATLVGRLVGRHELLYNKKKTVEGSLAFLGTAFLCIYIHFPPSLSFVTAIVACGIESLPIKSMDNLFVPLITGLILMLAEG